MDKLQWFKFSIADWRMGKIQRCSEITQIRFINLCCLYWNKEANLSYEDAEIEIDKYHLDILISKKIVLKVDENISIKFLDQQLKSIIETSKGKSKAANKRWENYRKSKAKAKQNNADVIHVHKDAMQNDADKIREDKIREENINKKEFLEIWNRVRYEVTKKKSFLNTVPIHEESIIKQLNKTDLEYALIGFFKQQTFPNGQDYTTNARHFLNHFDIYLQAYHDQNPNIYGKPEKK